MGYARGLHVLELFAERAELRRRFVGERLGAPQAGRAPQRGLSALGGARRRFGRLRAVVRAGSTGRLRGRFCHYLDRRGCLLFRRALLLGRLLLLLSP